MPKSPELPWYWKAIVSAISLSFVPNHSVFGLVFFLFSSKIPFCFRNSPFLIICLHILKPNKNSMNVLNCSFIFIDAQWWYYLLNNTDKTANNCPNNIGYTGWHTKSNPQDLYFCFPKWTFFLPEGEEWQKWQEMCGCAFQWRSVEWTSKNITVNSLSTKQSWQVYLPSGHLFQGKGVLPQFKLTAITWWEIINLKGYLHSELNPEQL